MKAVLLVVFALICAAPVAQAQAAPAASPSDPCAAHPRASFEVATVRPSDQPAGNSSMNSTGDRMEATMTARSLIEYAYGLRDFELSGGPGWLNDASWKVQATIQPPDPQAQDEEARKARINRHMQMVQSLLVDHFKLQCHMTTRELPVYELVINRGGLKLSETTAPEGQRHSIHSRGSGRERDFRATGITIAELAPSLSLSLGRNVLDKTRLTASYDVHLTWSTATTDNAEADAPVGPTIFTALEEQAGLKLVPAKGPVDVLVIDAIEKPAEN